MFKLNNCRVCGGPISAERLEVINSLNLSCLCLPCAENTVKPVKGIYMGEPGTSTMVFGDNVSPKSGIYKPEEEYKADENNDSDDNSDFNLTDNE